MSPPQLLTILDVDETLMHATEGTNAEGVDFTVATFQVRVRPFLVDFLLKLSGVSDIAVWSSASDAYVEEIARRIFPEGINPVFVWGRSRCTRKYNPERLEEYWVKDLRKAKRMGYPLERILMIDDSPEKVERHYGNHIKVVPFYGSADDVVLSRLAEYILRIANAPNMRTIEKRFWDQTPHKTTEG